MVLKEFPAPSDHPEDDYQELWETIPSRLYKTLEMMHQERIPDSDYSIGDIERLMKSLIARQSRPGEFIVVGGSWSLIGVDECAPSDVRVDLVFFPTYMVISLMTLFWYRYPERAKRMNGFQKALHDGLNFASARELYGHGMEGDAQRMEALRILNMGEVFRYLVEHVDENPKCRPLYNVLIDCKEKISRQYFSAPKEIFSLHKSLSILPNEVLWKTSDHFIWRSQCSDRADCLIIVEAPYANPPRAEIDTDIIANALALSRGVACIIGRYSRKYHQYTASAGSADSLTISEYRETLKKIMTDAGALDEAGKSSLKVFHLVIRGLGDHHGVDIEISTRKDRACKGNISDWFSTSLKEKLERDCIPWRRFTVQRNQLFSGGSPYLERNRNGEKGERNFAGFGENYNAMEIRISRGMRKSYLHRVIDSIGELIESYRYSYDYKG